MDRLRADDIIQINPDADSRCPGALVVVTEVHKWGIQGYLFDPYGVERWVRVTVSALAYIRVSHDDIIHTGGRLPNSLEAQEPEPTEPPEPPTEDV